MAAKTKYWTIRVAGGCEASTHGPYDTEIEQDEGMEDFSHELDANSDAVVKITIDPQGRLDATALSMEEMEEIANQDDDEDEDEDEED